MLWIRSIPSFTNHEWFHLFLNFFYHFLLLNSRLPAGFSNLWFITGVSYIIKSKFISLSQNLLIFYFQASSLWPIGVPTSQFVHNLVPFQLSIIPQTLFFVKLVLRTRNVKETECPLEVQSYWMGIKKTQMFNSTHGITYLKFYF